MRLKDFSTLNPLCKSERIEGDVSFVPMESLRCDKIDAQTMPIGEVRGKYTPFANGDLLVARVTPCFERGNIAVANGLLNGVGFGSSEIFVLRVNEKALARYLFYLTLTAKFQDGACATMCGVGGLKRISPEFMRTYELKLPPYIDQSRIVEYLDSRCAEIDRTVARLEQKRTAYGKLKRALINETVTRGLDKNAELVDSGVDWIGKVPREWKRVEFKTLVDIRNGADYKHIETDDGIPVVGSGGVFAYCSRKMYDGEVIFLGRKGTIDRPIHFKGAFWAVDTMFYAVPRRYMYRRIDDLDHCGAEDNVCKARTSAATQFVRDAKHSRGCDVVGRYVYYLATAFPFSKIATATALPSTTQTDFNSLVVCVPDVSEQRRIADYLDRKCAAIDAAVENVTRQIELYRKLKRSLIDEVVTGRRKVA